MALFKILKGLEKDLPTTYNEGTCYFCTDSKLFYIDTSDDAEGRLILNANNAQTLAGANFIAGGSEDESAMQIPSKEYIDTKTTVQIIEWESTD